MEQCGLLRYSVLFLQYTGQKETFGVLWTRLVRMSGVFPVYIPNVA